MKSKLTKIRGTSAIICMLVTALRVAGSTNVTIQGLLDKYEETWQTCSSQIVTDETLVENTDTQKGGTVDSSKSITEFRFDAETKRWDIMRTRWYDFKGEDAQVPPDQYYRQMFDGERIYDSWNFEEGNPRNIVNNKIVISLDENDKGREVMSAYHNSAPLNGYLKGDEKPIIEILREADKIELRKDMEVIGGSECYVIEATGKHGEYTVWLDPQHGYNIAKAKVHKVPGDIAWSKPLTGKERRVSTLVSKDGVMAALIDYSSSLENVRFEKIDDVWVPAEADIRVRRELEDGRIMGINKHCERTYIDVNPDFEAAGAFVADIPNGTLIAVPQISGIRYIWRDGELIPNLDELVIDSLDRMIQEEKGRPKAGFAVVTDKKVEPPRDKSSAADTQPGTRPDARPETTQTQRGVPLGFASFPASVLILIGLLSIAVVGWMMYRKFKRSNYVNL